MHVKKLWRAKCYEIYDTSCVVISVTLPKDATFIFATLERKAKTYDLFEVTSKKNKLHTYTIDLVGQEYRQSPDKVLTAHSKKSCI